MKKQYMTPVTNMVTINVRNMICQSRLGINSSSENEVVNTGDLLSRKSYSVWDDDDEEE